MLEGRGREPDDVDDLVRELGQPARLLRGAGNMLPQALVTRTFDLTRGKVDREGERRQRRAQLVARDGQELLLEVSQAAIGDVADDDDASLLHPVDQQWLTRSLIPAPGPLGFAQGKEHREGLAVGGPPLRPVRFGKWLTQFVFRDERPRRAKKPLKRGIGQLQTRRPGATTMTASLIAVSVASN